MKRYWVLMLIVFCSVASTCLAQQEATALVGEVRALLDQHDKAFIGQNAKGIMETYSSSPDIILMGTGPGEVYIGREGVEGAYTQFFTRFEPGSVSFDYVLVDAYSAGDAAWFGATSKVTATVKGEKKEFGFNVSGTMKKEEGKWRFVLMHFSRLGVVDQAEEEQAETKKSQ